MSAIDDVWAELRPACPRGCGRSLDDCYEVEDGGDCAGSELVRRLEAKVEEQRVQLRDAHNDLLDVRGILSPAGGEPVTPLSLVPSVAPAVQWLVDELERRRLELWRWDERLRAELAEQRRLAGIVVALGVCPRCGGLDGTHTVRSCRGSDPDGGEAVAGG